MNKSENKTPEQRRKALKKILAGTGAAGIIANTPEKWTAPLVNSVTLPAHAQTSGTETETPLPLNYTEMGIGAFAPSDDLQELLIPTAHAGFGGLLGGMICVNFNADMTTYSARVTIDDPARHELTGSGGTINSALHLTLACGDTGSLWLTLKSGPSLDGIPYDLCDSNGGTDCISGTLVDGECSAESGGCPGIPA